MSLERFPGTEPPRVSGDFPIYIGARLSAVVGYYNSRDARWSHQGMTVQSRDVSFWLGPDPLPTRKVQS